MPTHPQKFVEIPPALRKSVQTGEGILVYATNAILYLAAILPNGLHWKQAALYLTILNSVHAFQRGLLKAVAVLKGLGYGPITPSGLPPVPEQPAGEIKKAA